MRCKKCHKEIEDLKVCPYCKGRQITKKVMKTVKDTEEKIEEKVVKVSFFNNSKTLSYVLIGLFIFYLIFNGYNSNMSFIGYLVHNLFSVFFLVYFILLQFDTGKVHFKYLNIGACIVLGINLVETFFNIFVSFNIVHLFSSISSFLLMVFFLKAFFGNKSRDLDVIDNGLYFYLIIGSFFLSFLFREISMISNISPVFLFLDIIKLFIIVFISRYTYLYIEKEGGLFSEIKSLEKEIDRDKIGKFLKYMNCKYNLYQILSFLVFSIGIVVGIVLGSEYSICRDTIYNTCASNSFNFGIMLLVFFISFLLSILLYWQGEVISYLRKISDNKKKKVKKSVKNVD